MPGARVAPPTGSSTPSSACRVSFVTPPRRSTRGGSEVQSTMVDSTPTAHVAAVEHERNVVAELGAHRVRGRRAHPAEPVGRWCGEPAAERGRAAPAPRGAPAPGGPPCRAPRSPRPGPGRARRTTSVSGPGQHASASVRAAWARSLPHSSSCSAPGEVDDDRVVRRTALHRVEAPQRVVGSPRRRRARRPSRSGTRPGRRARRISTARWI